MILSYLSPQLTPDRGAEPRLQPLILRPRTMPEDLKQLRRDLRLSRTTFGRVLGCSERGLANWEAGRPIQAIYLNRINELRNLFSELSKVVEPDTIGEWLLTPNEQFDGLKPVEVIERGETFRLWKTIFHWKGKP